MLQLVVDLLLLAMKHRHTKESKEETLGVLKQHAASLVGPFRAGQEDNVPKNVADLLKKIHPRSGLDIIRYWMCSQCNKVKRNEHKESEVCPVCSKQWDAFLDVFNIIDHAMAMYGSETLAKLMRYYEDRPPPPEGELKKASIPP